MRVNSARQWADVSTAVALDACLLDINRRGVRMDTSRVRVRLHVRLCSGDEILLIVPIWQDRSTPYIVSDGALFKGYERIADVVAEDFDDAVLSYPRNAGRCLTLNTNSRSGCTGCVFCHYSLEVSEDPRIPAESAYLQAYVFGLLRRHGLRDLSGLSRVGLSTGCFAHEAAAIQHVVTLYDELKRAGFQGGFHLLSSVVRSRDGIATLADRVPGFHLILTVECFENRSTLLKPTKASLSVGHAVQVLARCREANVGCDFTYIAGLDRLEAALVGLRELNSYVTEFPKIQVFQPHASFMRNLDVSRVVPDAYYEELKASVESDFRQTSFRPAHWQNYRSPWTLSFDDKMLPSPVI